MAKPLIIRGIKQDTCGEPWPFARRCHVLVHLDDILLLLQVFIIFLVRSLQILVLSFKIAGIKMRRNSQLSMCKSFIFVLMASLFAVIQAATFYNQTYNNVFERGLSYRGNDRASKEFRIPESLEQRNFRKSKLFPLFTIIRFSNEVCRTTNEETGICYTRNQCNTLGGLPQGSCASGLGVCCRFIASCGAVIYQNSTSFQNPNYPSKYAPTGGSDVCQVRIKKSQNVCQLRLNFIVFDVEGPSSAGSAQTGNTAVESGVCKIDSLAITSSGASVPSLCGNMNGQHLYVDFGSSDTITLNLLLGGNNNNARERTWNIEILTIPCNSVARAPTGCLQYYTGVSGMVESFNYQGGTHLANLDYSVCVRLEDGMRFIDWSPCAPFSVRFGGGPATVPTAVTPNMVCNTGGGSGTGTGNNALIPDYLVIPQGVSFPPIGTTNTQPTSTSDRFCDLSFQMAGSYVRSSAKPFFMHIRTDSMEGGGTTDATSQGFCLRWQQNPQ